MPIVAAVGTAVRSDDPALASRLEEAMVAAVRQAMADGVALDDSVEMLRRKAEARRQVLEA